MNKKLTKILSIFIIASIVPYINAFSCHYYLINNYTAISSMINKHLELHQRITQGNPLVLKFKVKKSLDQTYYEKALEDRNLPTEFIRVEGDYYEFDVFLEKSSDSPRLITFINDTELFPENLTYQFNRIESRKVKRTWTPPKDTRNPKIEKSFNEIHQKMIKKGHYTLNVELELPFDFRPNQLITYLKRYLGDQVRIEKIESSLYRYKIGPILVKSEREINFLKGQINYIVKDENHNFNFDFDVALIEK